MGDSVRPGVPVASGGRSNSAFSLSRAGCSRRVPSLHKETINRSFAFPSYKTELEFKGADPMTQRRYIIPAVGGHYYVHGEGIIGAASDRGGPIAKRLVNLPFILTGQIGDDGINVQFRLQDFDLVAKVMRPKTKRTLSPEHKAKLFAAGQKHRFGRSPKSANQQETAAVEGNGNE